jgi:hypothetical protein
LKFDLLTEAKLHPAIVVSLTGGCVCAASPGSTGALTLAGSRTMKRGQR